MQTKEWLYQEYIINELTTIEIGQIVGRNPCTISRWLKRYGIKARNIKTDKSKQRMSNTWKKQGHPRGMAGRQHSEETKMLMSLRRKGSKNANWKGGLTLLVKGIRRSPEYYQWHKTVLIRDNHTCQDCKSVGIVDAHHIQSLLDYPEGIFEVDNGLTLCKDCHKRHTSWQRISRRRKTKFKRAE